jgi:hypothetical protein
MLFALQFSMVHMPAAYVTFPARLVRLQVAPGPTAMQSPLSMQESPTFFGGAMQAPFSQTGVAVLLQERQGSPFEPQMLLFCREVFRVWQVPFGSRHPSQAGVPPPAPPPMPPPMPPPAPEVAQANVVASQVVFDEAQLTQALPDVPQVELSELSGRFTHMVPEQHPSQVAGLHG